LIDDFEPDTQITSVFFLICIEVKISHYSLKRKKIFITDSSFPFFSINNERKIFTLNRYSMRKTIFFLSLGFILTISGWAQNDPSAINSSGGSATYNFVTYEWSVGEMAAVETFSKNSLIVTQGFLQPSKSISDNVDQLKNDNDKIVVYPDPGKQTLFLETSFEKTGKLNYLLVDLSGRTLLRKEAKVNGLNSKQSVDLTNFPNGVYLLKVSFINSDEAIVKTFKIQK